MTNNFIYLDQDEYCDFLCKDADLKQLKRDCEAWHIGAARRILNPEAYAQCLRVCEENEEEPKTYKEAFFEVLENVVSACEEVEECARESFYNRIDRWENFYGACPEGLMVNYVDTTDFVEQVASGCRKYLRVIGE